MVFIRGLIICNCFTSRPITTSNEMQGIDEIYCHTFNIAHPNLFYCLLFILCCIFAIKYVYFFIKHLGHVYIECVIESVQFLKKFTVVAYSRSLCY